MLHCSPLLPLRETPAHTGQKSKRKLLASDYKAWLDPDAQILSRPWNLLVSYLCISFIFQRRTVLTSLTSFRYVSLGHYSSCKPLILAVHCPGEERVLLPPIVQPMPWAWFSQFRMGLFAHLEFITVTREVSYIGWLKAIKTYSDSESGIALKEIQVQ